MNYGIGHEDERPGYGTGYGTYYRGSHVHMYKMVFSLLPSTQFNGAKLERLVFISGVASQWECEFRVDGVSGT